MKINNIEINGIASSIKASKYPFSVDIDTVSNELTDTVKKLASSKKGEGHDQFLTGVNISFDLTFSNKAWIELERYRFVYFVSSQSTMHKIAMFDIKEQCNKYVDDRIIDVVEELKTNYNRTKDTDDYLKLLYSVPVGFELTARLTTNYRQLKTIYSQRKNHKLPEWRMFCRWIEGLPYFAELIGGE